MEKISLPLKVIVAPAFAPALQKLIAAEGDKGKMLLSARDHYRLSKTIKAMRTEIESHREALTALLKKFNAHSNLDEFRETIRALESKVTANTATAEEKESFVGALKKLPQLEASEQLVLYKTDPGYEDFVKQKDDLESQRVELFLDSKIKVNLDDCRTLNAFDMEALEPIVEFNELSE